MYHMKTLCVMVLFLFKNQQQKLLIAYFFKFTKIFFHIKNQTISILLVIYLAFLIRVIWFLFARVYCFSFLVRFVFTILLLPRFFCKCHSRQILPFHIHTVEKEWEANERKKTKKLREKVWFRACDAKQPFHTIFLFVKWTNTRCACCRKLYYVLWLCLCNPHRQNITLFKLRLFFIFFPLLLLLIHLYFFSFYHDFLFHSLVLCLFLTLSLSLCHHLPYSNNSSLLQFMAFVYDFSFFYSFLCYNSCR